MSPVVLVCGTGEPVLSWQLFQVPALVAAGYRVITFDNRGMPPSACPDPPYSVGDLAAATAGLIEAPALGPCRVAGRSLGADVGCDDRLQALAGLRVPTLVMVFSLDALTLAPLGREVAEAIPGARLLEIPESGHAGPFENAAVVNQALVELFSRC